MPKSDGLIITIQFDEDIIDAVFKPEAYTVSGYEYQYVTYTEMTYGPLVPVTYPVLSVSKTDRNVIQLVMENPAGAFKNVVGDLTVAYDMAVGELRGHGGPVTSFSMAFTPADLSQVVSPLVHESLTATVGVETITVSLVTYLEGYGPGEWITGSVNVADISITVTQVGGNPL